MLPVPSLSPPSSFFLPPWNHRCSSLFRPSRIVSKPLALPCCPYGRHCSSFYSTPRRHLTSRPSTIPQLRTVAAWSSTPPSLHPSRRTLFFSSGHLLSSSPPRAKMRCPCADVLLRHVVPTPASPWLFPSFPMAPPLFLQCCATLTPGRCSVPLPMPLHPGTLLPFSSGRRLPSSSPPTMPALRRHLPLPHWCRLPPLPPSFPPFAAPVPCYAAPRRASSLDRAAVLLAGPSTTAATPPPPTLLG